MGKPARATHQKRGREKAKQAKRQEKLDRRNVRKTEKENAPAAETDEDPDLAGIRPGPQPRLDEEEYS